MNKIKRYMDTKGLTVRELSAKTGINSGHLCNIANGKAPVTAKSARRLAAVMGLKNWWALCSEREEK